MRLVPQLISRQTLVFKYGECGSVGYARGAVPLMAGKTVIDHVNLADTPVLYLAVGLLRRALDLEPAEEVAIKQPLA